MADKSVNVRIGVAGGTQTKRELVGVGAAGKAALDRIAKATGPASHALQAMSKATASVRGSFEALASRLGPIGAGMAALGPIGLGAAAGIVAAGGAFAAAAFATKSFLTGVVKTSIEFEALQFRLEALTGSSDAANKAMAWIKDFAKRTPLEVADVVQAFSTLKTFGIDPMKPLYDGTKTALDALTDAMARSGLGASDTVEAARAIGKAWTANKLQAEEINQLVDRGIPVWDLLSKVTGKSAAELVKLSEKGELGRETINKLIIAMGQFSRGASEKFAGSWPGIMSMLSDSWTEFQTKVGQTGVFENLKGILQKILGYVNQLADSGALARIAKAIGEPFAVAFDAAAKAIDGFIAQQGGIEGFARGVENAISSFIASLTGGKLSTEEFSALIRDKIAGAGHVFKELGAIIEMVAGIMRGFVTVTMSAARGLENLHKWLGIETPKVDFGNLDPLKQFKFEPSPAAKWIANQARSLLGPGQLPAALPATGVGALPPPGAAPGSAVAPPLAQNTPPPPRQSVPNAKTPASTSRELGPFDFSHRIGGALDVNIMSPLPVRVRAKPVNPNVPVNVNQGWNFGEAAGAR